MMMQKSLNALCLVQTVNNCLRGINGFSQSLAKNVTQTAVHEYLKTITSNRSSVIPSRRERETGQSTDHDLESAGKTADLAQRAHSHRNFSKLIKKWAADKNIISLLCRGSTVFTSPSIPNTSKNDVQWSHPYYLEGSASHSPSAGPKASEHVETIKKQLNHSPNFSPECFKAVNPTVVHEV